MTGQFVVRKYTDNDEQGTFELIRVCFGVSDYVKWHRLWTWEYEENPYGGYIWVVEHEDQIVASSSWIPVNIKVGESIFKSAIGAYSATHPDYRRKGLQWKIIDHAKKEFLEEEIYFYYSLPAEVWTKAIDRHMREGLYVGDKFCYMIRFLNIKEFVLWSKAKIVPFLLRKVMKYLFGSKKNYNNFRIRRMKELEDKVNEFWKDVSSNFGVIVARDKKYLDWRYQKKPDSNFEFLVAEDKQKILGYAVVAYENNAGYIVDLLVHPERSDVTQALINMGVQRLREEKVKHVIFSSSGKNLYESSLRDCGFIPFGGKYPFHITICSSSNIPADFLKNPNNWYLTAGDTDGIMLEMR